MILAPAIRRVADINPWIAPRGSLTIDRDDEFAGSLAACIVPTTTHGVVDLVRKQHAATQTDSVCLRRETRGLTIDCTTNVAGDGTIKFYNNPLHQLTGDIDFSWFWIFKPIAVGGIYPTTCACAGGGAEAGYWAFTSAAGSRLIQICTSPGVTANINFGAAGNWPTTIQWYSIGFTRKKGGTYYSYQDGVNLASASNASIAAGSHGSHQLYLGSGDQNRSRSYYNCLYVWKDRLLSDIDMRALHARPYRMLKADFPDYVSRAGTSPPPPPPGQPIVKRSRFVPGSLGHWNRAA